MDLKHRLGKRLRALRQQSGLSQSALARAADLNRVFVGEVEQGHKAATIETIGKLARALGVSPRQLLEFDSEEPSAVELLARRVRALAIHASGQELRRFERLAVAFFEDLSPSKD